MRTTMDRTTPHNALIYIMITMSAADRKITDSELTRITEIIRQVPVFRDYDLDHLVKAVEACGNILGEEDGLHTLLELIAGSLPRKLHETAYVLALEVAAADLCVPQEEVRLLELLADELRLDKLVTAALERAAKARHQTI